MSRLLFCFALGDAEHLDSGPHACVTNTLRTESSPQIHIELFAVNSLHFCFDNFYFKAHLEIFVFKGKHQNSHFIDYEAESLKEHTSFFPGQVVVVAEGGFNQEL